MLASYNATLRLVQTMTEYGRQTENHCSKLPKELRCKNITNIRMAPIKDVSLNRDYRLPFRAVR